MFAIPHDIISLLLYVSVDDLDPNCYLIFALTFHDVYLNLCLWQCEVSLGMHLHGKAPYKSVIIITSSGAGCICNYTNTKSPRIHCTLSSGVHFLVIWCTLSRSVYCLEKKHYSLLLNINIRDMNETCKKHNYISPLTYVQNFEWKLQAVMEK